MDLPGLGGSLSRGRAEAAERWDLDFWQSRTPQERLSAFVHLRRDVELAQAAREDRAGDGR